jgi:hypothetical protein
VLPLQVTFWATAASPEPVWLLTAFSPATAEGTDAEPLRHRHHDLVRGQALLLGRDGEATAELAGERHGGADLRMREGRGCKNDGGGDDQRCAADAGERMETSVAAFSV